MAKLIRLKIAAVSLRSRGTVRLPVELCVVGVTFAEVPGRLWCDDLILIGLPNN